MSNFTAAINTINTVNTAKIAEIRRAAERTFLATKIGLSDIRPIWGLYATNLGYLPWTKAVYLYQNAVFIGQNEI